MSAAAAVVATGAEPFANPLHEQLARAIDLPTAAARGDAAAALAKTSGTTLTVELLR